MYRRLDPGQILETLERTTARIDEGLPGSGLSRVCTELTTTAHHTAKRAADIAAHNWPLRISVGLVIAGGVVALASALKFLHLEEAQTTLGLVQSLEAAVNLLILFGGATWF